MTGGLRVTGGRLRGRKFRAPQSGVRPTSDRVREALFGRLGDLDGRCVLDLYAGSGSLGIESVSRGAREVVFVERARRTIGFLRANLVALEIQEIVRVFSGDVSKVVRRLGRKSERFDLVLLDPPYGSEEAGQALAALVESEILAPGAMVVLERARRHPPPRVEGLSELDERRYGDTVIARFVAAAVGKSGQTDEAK